MAALSFRRSTEGVVKIGEDVVASLWSFRQLESNATEAGGVLLGRHLLDGVNLVVDHATPPQPSDRRTRFSFFRSRAHQHLARLAWKSTDHTSAYIGLWHTHPEPDPRPSATDVADWERALVRGRYPGHHLYFLIVGQARIRLWEGRSSCELRECSLVPPVRNPS